jgi:cytochrome c2
MKHKTGIILSLIVMIAGISVALTGRTSSEKTTNDNHYSAALPVANNGKQLLETKCNICHGIKDSAAAMLAPPFVNIKSKYKAVYKTREEFVKGIVDFTMNPSEKNALMRGSLKRFAVMPKMGYSKADLTTIANYIYDSDFEKPSWFK